MIYEIPVVGSYERVVDQSAILSRRELRECSIEPVPRDARPSRSRRERLPLGLRLWGAQSRRITAS
jgi:hypothetical protein